MKSRHIAIEREYGSGGTQIARRLAEECGVPCYGREILEAVSKRYGVSVERIERYEESTTGSFLYSIMAMARAQTGNSDLLSTEGRVFLAEQKIIRELAAKELTVFLGHCAAEAFEDRGRVVRVFIRGQAEDKKRRVKQEYGIADSHIEETMRRFDKKRANYYYANTLRRWDDRNNYDIVLDSSSLGVEGCVAVLKPLLCGREEP